MKFLHLAGLAAAGLVLPLAHALPEGSSTVLDANVQQAGPFIEFIHANTTDNEPPNDPLVARAIKEHDPRNGQRKSLCRGGSWQFVDNQTAVKVTHCNALAKTVLAILTGWFKVSDWGEPPWRMVKLASFLDCQISVKRTGTEDKPIYIGTDDLQRWVLQAIGDLPEDALMMPGFGFATCSTVHSPSVHFSVDNINAPIG